MDANGDDNVALIVAVETVPPEIAPPGGLGLGTGIPFNRGKVGKELNELSNDKPLSDSEAEENWPVFTYVGVFTVKGLLKFQTIPGTSCAFEFVTAAIVKTAKNESVETKVFIFHVINIYRAKIIDGHKKYYDFPLF